MENHNKSLFEEALKYMPGGVNSPVRAFGQVGGSPLFIAGACGAYLTDANGKEYIDYLGSWGPMILGHAHPAIVQAAIGAINHSPSFGAPSEAEVILARKVTEYTGNDMVRFTCSGTEATMTAIRLARAYTGRNKIIKFEGCYHGHADAFLVKAGSGVATLGIAGSKGVTPGTIADTLVAGYNQPDALKTLIKTHEGEVAALIIEPVAGNMGCVTPLPGFLEGVRGLCTHYGIVLIFDEVITGFRLARGGAQELFGVKADLVTYGKIIGGGFPVGAVAGKKQIMEWLAPMGPVYQAGTLSGNPVAMAAGLKTLEILDEKVYRALNATSKTLADGLEETIQRQGLHYTVNQCGSLLTLFFTPESVNHFTDVQQCDTKSFAFFFQNMLADGVYLPPSQFESWFISTAHTSHEISRTLEIAARHLPKKSVE